MCASFNLSFVIHCVLLAFNPLTICDTQDPLTPYGSCTQRGSEMSTEHPGFTELNNIYGSECPAEFHNAACSCCNTDSLWTLTTMKARPCMASLSQVVTIFKKIKLEWLRGHAILDKRSSLWPLSPNKHKEKKAVEAVTESINIQILYQSRDVTQ